MDSGAKAVHAPHLDFMIGGAEIFFPKNPEGIAPGGVQCGFAQNSTVDGGGLLASWPHRPIGSSAMSSCAAAFELQRGTAGSAVMVYWFIARKDGD